MISYAFAADTLFLQLARMMAHLERFSIAEFCICRCLMKRSMPIVEEQSRYRQLLGSLLQQMPISGISTVATAELTAERCISTACTSLFPGSACPPADVESDGITWMAFSDCNEESLDEQSWWHGCTASCFSCLWLQQLMTSQA